ncbi:hypothetical protein MMUR_55670 [Mycolicibacterium murale]|uniref:Uncharacterized protein n=1 Tax=Mycolicibacterium murale TaxID=182220 RepID=A0A7I9WUQ9_9MYCO|nr:hypothetical protein [Mycolicibacterium murale]MCV7185705.1 hypothetical protein [Mycolicibacterium murale]GFG61431.1 hypothetical protein MMUR_55670 [Mycolicibacterium murale]
MADTLLYKRWRSLRRKLRTRVQDAKTFTHPAVKIILMAILIAATAAAVIYALREDPAKHPPAEVGSPSAQVATVPGPPAMATLTA